MRVVWSPLALAQAEEATDYIAAERPATAAKWLDGLMVVPAFPRMVRRREVKADAGRLLYRGTAMELRPVVCRNRPGRAGLASNQRSAVGS